jgi:hypothetical protein
MLFSYFGNDIGFYQYPANNGEHFMLGIGNAPANHHHPSNIRGHRGEQNSNGLADESLHAIPSRCPFINFRRHDNGKGFFCGSTLKYQINGLLFNLLAATQQRQNHGGGNTQRLWQHANG